MDEAWKLFEGTGKVTDYLNYCRNRATDERGEQTGKVESECLTAAGRIEKERETGWDRM